MAKGNYEVSGSPENDEVQLEMLGARKEDAGRGNETDADGFSPTEPYDPHLYRNRPAPTT